MNPLLAFVLGTGSRWRNTLTACVLLSGPLCDDRSSHASHGVTVERVIEAWEAREKRFSSAVISWQERKVSIGLKNRIALLRRTSDDSGTADLRDDEQVVHVFNRRLAFADGKIYYDDDEPALFVGQGINPQRFKVEANSTQFKRIMETDAGIDFKKTGLITSNIRHLTSLATLKPVLAHFRPILSGDSQ